MHGRHRERETIARLLADARGGRSGALVLRGEAGIGKSSLLRHAAESAAASGPMRVLACAGVDSEVEHAFSGLLGLLRPVLDHLDALPGVQAEALRGALGLTDSAAPDFPVSDFLVSAAVLTLLAAVAADRPLLVTVDDVQWLDRASAAALLFAARRLADEPIAMLLAVREPEPLPVNTAGLSELVLYGLPPEDAARLLDAHGWTLPARQRDALFTATGGNPLALIELARLDGPDRAMPDLAMTRTLPVSARVRAAFLRQVEGLSADGRAVLLVAAAEETGDAGTVLGAAARLGLPADALDPAERSGLVELNGIEIRFRHPLIRSAVYADAPFEHRRAAHLAIAAHLSATGKDGQAIWHRAVATTAPDEKIAAELEHSADAARRRGGAAAAISVLQHAARLSESPADRRQRTVTAAFVALDAGRPGLARTLVDQVMAEPVPAVTLAQLNGIIELYGGDPAIAYSHLMRCAELMSSAEPEEAAWTLLLAGGSALHAGDMEAALLATRRITDLDCSPATLRAAAGLLGGFEGVITGAELWELPGILPRGRGGGDERQWMWATVIGWMGPDDHQALRLAEATGRRARAEGSAALLTEVLFYQADIEFRLGHWAEGTAHAEEGLRFSYETGQRGWTANFLAQSARFAAVRGEAAACRRYARQALEIAFPLRERIAAATATGALGLLALGEGASAEAFAELMRLFERGSPHSNDFVALAMLPDLVEAAVRAGDPEPARRIVQAVEPRTGAVRGPMAQGGKHRSHAMLADDAHAESHYRSALANCGLDQRPFDRARTELLYGEWLHRNHRRTEAQPMLRAASETFDTLGAQPWARRALARLRAAGGTPPRPDRPVAALLSPQELEVSRLAAKGLSNREIGDRMHLSPRTVGSHLYRAFPKLGISTRAELRDLDLD
ncbi:MULTISPECIES: AAA family ATPase [Streptosporangium]|uniref:DNA-binding CsgD family transcriptional regulator n=1 Tax=Streptosporangium brasiliense TaxID=47480 RepID=A0ABT9RJ02_9ACTN|nr:LuxR family transcriptional regulator [Streptosporangium brasiliense]MDP9869235.1 DNA-binding CsgD family transcriptional regulator [Streptosporangium brasiliense]